MDAVKPVVFVTPDGVERKLRSTAGARKLISDHFGMPLKDALNKYDSGAFPVVLWALMHDEDGNPPAGLTVSRLAFTLGDDADTRAEIMAVIAAAYSNGKLEKNEAKAAILRAIEVQANSTGLDTSEPVLSV